MLAERLAGARRYDRIAGYFRASLLDVAGEALEGVGQIRIVCNGELDPNDVAIARAASQGARAVAQTLAARWQESEDRLDTLLKRERYQRLHALLASGRMKVRVVPSGQGRVFLHGKAGVIETADGSTHAFVGSANDSVGGWRHSYELIWEDDAPDAAQWVQAEFDHFWDQGVDLPEAVIRHIGAVADRKDYASIEDARGDGDRLAAAALAERPLTRAGQILRPWQKRFVHYCVEDQRQFGRARFLIADDVGLGKTLSMAAAALVLALQDGGPVLILAPATLTWQWQAELWDMLGVPAAVWSSQTKQWIDPEGYPRSPRGDAAQVVRCPFRFGILSTGLIVNGDDEGERGMLRRRRFGVVVLDEAHKARARRARDGSREGANNLMAFMEATAKESGSILLGTATPIQLDPVELWDLVFMMHQGAPHVLGQGVTDWRRQGSMGYVTGRQPWPREPDTRWSLFKDPLPPAAEHRVFRDVREFARLPEATVQGPRWTELSLTEQQDFLLDFEEIASRHNPIIRRVIRRTRPMLEERGLLPPIKVLTHPTPEDRLPAGLLEDEGLAMGLAFREAYEAAERFCRAYAATRPAAGFLKTILLRRIGSSPMAGLMTARGMLEQADEVAVEMNEVDDGEQLPKAVSPLTGDEATLLRTVVSNLEAVVTEPDPKVRAIIHYLRDRNWLETDGAILFSQYYTTAEWVAERLVEAFPGEPVALYAGGGKSFVTHDGTRRLVDRDKIKKAVQSGDIRLLAATDAACEGLNLQRLGAQFNVDLPWNPSKLEQRKGRVQRIGQARLAIHVVNLRYAGTVEDDVYRALSRRFGDIFSAIGQLPDGFEDGWVTAVLKDRDSVRLFPSRAETIIPPMQVRYARDISDDEGLDWEFTDRVISERHLAEFLRQPWG
ncbi:MAG: helicase-related protein [Sphingomonadaceae bacterium]